MPLAGLESTQKMKQWFLVSLIIAVSVLGLGFILALPVIFYVGFALLSAWILAVASFFGFVLPPRATCNGQDCRGRLQAVGRFYSDCQHE